MKKIILSIVLVVIALFLKAAIITIDNNYPSIGDFTTLQGAHDSASSGDTIYVYPSDFPYLAIGIAKKLVIIGSGFDLAQSTLKTSKLKGVLTFLPSASGSVIEGFDSYLNDFYIIVNADMVNVKKNKLKKTVIKSNHSGIKIEQNFFLYTNEQPYPYTSDYLIRIDTSNVGIIISNNKMINSSWGQSAYGTIGGGGILVGLGSSATIVNNVINLDSPYSSCNSNFASIIAVQLDSEYFIYNNIFWDGILGGESTRYVNNMSSCYILYGGSGNQNMVDLNLIFVDSNNWNYHLKPGSPAIGSGQGGIDMGIYGGNTPYDDNGYPGIPSIYFLEVPYNGSQQNGVNVTIKIKSNSH